MKLQLTGCSHHESDVGVREQLAFSPAQAREALARFRETFPDSEAVLLSTCNRVEFYAAAEDPNSCPTHESVVEFLADFHGLRPIEIMGALFERTGEEAVRHLFTVAASLDSMVVGEAQILSQVKQAYDTATSDDAAGPLTHAVFQAALRVAKRVATETDIQKKRVSIPSVAVADYAKQHFDHFEDKEVLVIGAGDMAEETLSYLVSEGAEKITVINRSQPRAVALAERFNGRAESWESLSKLLVEADIVVSTTGATEPVVTLADFKKIEHDRYQRHLFVLDLAVPRDFDPEIDNCIGVYLYSLDDLAEVCDRNKQARQDEWPRAEKIIESETARFMAEINHRATGPTIRRLKTLANELMRDEMDRLWNKLDATDAKTRNEVEKSVSRLVNKLLHPPLESLRDEAQQGAPHGLLSALKRLFKLTD